MHTSKPQMTTKIEFIFYILSIIISPHINMATPADKVIKLCEKHIGDAATEYYYKQVGDLIGQIEGYQPVKNLSTYDMYVSKKNAPKKSKATKKTTTDSTTDKTADKTADKATDKTIDADDAVDDDAAADDTVAADDITADDTAAADDTVAADDTAAADDTVAADDTAAAKTKKTDENKPQLLINFTNIEFKQMMDILRRKYVAEINKITPDDLAAIQTTLPDFPVKSSSTVRNYLIFMHRFKFMCDVVHNENCDACMPQCAIDFIYKVISTADFNYDSAIYTHVPDDNTGYMHSRFIQDLASFKQHKYIHDIAFDGFNYMLKVICRNITNRVWFQRGVMSKSYLLGEFFAAGMDAGLIDYILGEMPEPAPPKKKTAKKPAVSSTTADTTLTAAADVVNAAVAIEVKE
jgi:hypothetical protein